MIGHPESCACQTGQGVVVPLPFPSVALDLPFPHPIEPRPIEHCTPAERAFFVESLRRLRPFCGKAMHIRLSDDVNAFGIEVYRLVIRYRDRMDEGLGETPGEALAALIFAVRAVFEGRHESQGR